MIGKAPDFHIKIAQTEAEVMSALHLRYSVFAEELGANGPSVDHQALHEKDSYDPSADHLLLIDVNHMQNNGVVGTYRLMPQSSLPKGLEFYSATEFDLSPLLSSGRKLLELGRSCVHQDYRGGTAMFELWAGLAKYVEDQNIDVMFGVASFHGTDVDHLAHALSYLHHSHKAPAALRTQAIGPTAAPMNILAPDQIDRRAAMLAIPALIKAYLRLGGFVGQGAWIDHGFNTTDVCMILDTDLINPKQRALYRKDRTAP